VTLLSTDQVHALVDAAMQRFGTPGYSVAIVQGDDSAAFGFGVCDTLERRPVDADTTFQIASCGKAYTATLAAMLVDEGALAWDDPVRRHLPEFQMHDERLSSLATVRDLLAMRLGYLGKGALNFGRNPELGIEVVFDRLRHLEVAAGFRELFTYLNPAYALVAEIISRLTGKAFAQALAERVIATLGQTNTFSHEGEFLPMGPHAFPHVILDDAAPRPIAATCGGRTGEGCIYSTANDAVPWLHFHLNGGLVSTTALSEMHRPQVLGHASPRLGNQFVSYGFGWQLRDTPHGRIALHEGVEFGASSFTLLDPARRTGVAISANFGGGAAVKTLAYSLIDALAGRAPRDWLALFETLAADERTATATRHLRLLDGPVAPPLTGAYHHPASGMIDIIDATDGLRVRFRDARVYDALLVPVGDGLFQGRFDFPGMRALAQQPLGLRFFRDDAGPAIRIADMGVARLSAP
jgi:CubicO group peptidase (beta-lactamase class C family)